MIRRHCAPKAKQSSGRISNLNCITGAAGNGVLVGVARGLLRFARNDGCCAIREKRAIAGAGGSYRPQDTAA